MNDLSLKINKPYTVNALFAGKSHKGYLDCVSFMEKFVGVPKLILCDYKTM